MRGSWPFLTMSPHLLQKGPLVTPSDPGVPRSPGIGLFLFSDQLHRSAHGWSRWTGLCAPVDPPQVLAWLSVLQTTVPGLGHRAQAASPHPPGRQKGFSVWLLCWPIVRDRPGLQGLLSPWGIGAVHGQGPGP